MPKLPQSFLFKELPRPFFYSFTIFFALLAAGTVVAFTGPLSPVPACTSGNPGCDAPLNISGNAQAKAGGLLLNTGGATNGLIVQSGNVGIGTVSPASTLDVNGKITVGANGIDLKRSIDGSVSGNIESPSGTNDFLFANSGGQGSSIRLNSNGNIMLGAGNGGKVTVTSPGGIDLTRSLSGGVAGNIGSPSGTNDFLWINLGGQAPSIRLGSDGNVNITDYNNTANLCLNGSCVSSFSGTGATGATGPQGPAGPQGPTGATGPQGPAGGGATHGFGGMWDVADGTCNQSIGATLNPWTGSCSCPSGYSAYAIQNYSSGGHIIQVYYCAF